MEIPMPPPPPNRLVYESGRETKESIQRRKQWESDIAEWRKRYSPTK